MSYIIGQHYHMKQYQYYMKADLNLTQSYGSIYFQVHHTVEETSFPPKEIQHFFKWNYPKEKRTMHK